MKCEADIQTLFYKKVQRGYLDFLGWRLVRLAFSQRQLGLAQAPPTLSAEGAVTEMDDGLDLQNVVETPEDFL